MITVRGFVPVGYCNVRIDQISQEIERTHDDNELPSFIMHTRRE